MKQAAQMPSVSINGHEIENVLSFEYLGCDMSGDGNEASDIKHRLDVGQARFSSLFNIWRDHRLKSNTKINLHKASVCSTLEHDCEAWTLSPAALKRINGFNSRCLHNITFRPYREEAVDPSFDLVSAIKLRRLRWLGHILRMPDDRLLRKVVCSLASSGPPYPDGSIFMDCSLPLDQLVLESTDRAAWRRKIRPLSEP